SCYRSVACHQAHDRLPDSRRVTRLDVVANQFCIFLGCVETFSQIFEKDPHKHRADRHAYQCKPVCRIEQVGRSCRLVYVGRHRKPLSCSAKSTSSWATSRSIAGKLALSRAARPSRPPVVSALAVYNAFSNFVIVGSLTFMYFRAGLLFSEELSVARILKGDTSYSGARNSFRIFRSMRRKGVGSSKPQDRTNAPSICRTTSSARSLAVRREIPVSRASRSRPSTQTEKVDRNCRW